MTFKILLSETILFPASCGVQYSTGELIVKGDEGVGVEKGCHMDLFVTNVPRFWGSWAGFYGKIATGLRKTYGFPEWEGRLLAYSV